MPDGLELVLDVHIQRPVVLPYHPRLIILLCSGNENLSFSLELTNNVNRTGPTILELFDGQALCGHLVGEVPQEGLRGADVVDRLERVRVRFEIIVNSLIVLEHRTQGVGEAYAELLCKLGGSKCHFMVLEVGYRHVHLRHQVADLSRVRGLGVDDLGCLWSRNNDWALALEGVGSLIVGGCGSGITRCRGRCMGVH